MLVFLTLQLFFNKDIRTVSLFDVFLLFGADYRFILQHEVILFEVRVELVTLFTLQEPEFVREAYETGNGFDSLENLIKQIV